MHKLATLSRKEYQALVETLEVMSDADLMASLRRGIRQAKQGKLIPWDRTKQKLGLRRKR